MGGPTSAPLMSHVEQPPTTSECRNEHWSMLKGKPGFNVGDTAYSSSANSMASSQSDQSELPTFGTRTSCLFTREPKSDELALLAGCNKTTVSEGTMAPQKYNLFSGKCFKKLLLLYEQYFDLKYED